ncbi:DJ-1/PfpI family protein [Virgibacillus salinus]|uniref:Putative intracellular protease/amidase n=1 Tax=Virgibacillus salinus TaxID=553311 RepID=A0A1H1EV42_9BACI|nr:DJ-1/PfpI family protein [Virgibacillus salinus]SDQ92595.1 Putative intracellular protease/amidase [Virgibacillus salinus]
MITVYNYVLDTLSDWELGYVTAELNSGQYFKKQSDSVSVKTVCSTEECIITKGGMTVKPDITVDEIIIDSSALLLLPGADTWDDSIHIPIIEKATELLECGATVAAICGATTALAGVELLDKWVHTSNSLEYLKMVCPSYKGEPYYRDVKAIKDGNLITASSAGGLLFAKLIIEDLEVFSKDTLEAWYNYFDKGDATYFYDLMQTLED